MHLSIDALAYKAINNALSKGKETVAAKGIWLELNSEYNIGILQADKILLNSKDRIDIAKIVKNQTDLDPRFDHYEDLTQMSRTEISKRTRNEKFLSLPPREAFVEVRILSQDICAPGYQGMLVDDLLAIEKKCIISIENFDTFTNAQRKTLQCALPIAGETLVLVFAGDNVASPKAFKELIKLNSTPWLHYSDFDPAGLHIGAVRIKCDYLIIPNPNSFTQLIKLSKPATYHEQSVQFNSVSKRNILNLAEHISFMQLHNIAVMQEQLTSHEISLVLLKL